MSSFKIAKADAYSNWTLAVYDGVISQIRNADCLAVWVYISHLDFWQGGSGGSPNLTEHPFDINELKQKILGHFIDFDEKDLNNALDLLIKNNLVKKEISQSGQEMVYLKGFSSREMHEDGFIEVEW